MRFFPESIPPALKNQKHWAMWKKETRDGKPAKVPYQPDGKKAKSNDASTWHTFNTVLLTFQDIGGFDGVCWMMPVKPSDIIFVDIDNCIKDSIIEPWALEIVKRFDSYTERSQSGNGIHILIKGTKPIKRCRKNGSPYEIYDCLRPCYLTGDVVEGHGTIEVRQEQLNQLYEEIFSEELEQARKGPAQRAPSARSSLSDNELILKATLAKGGNEFKALFDGSTLGYNGDDSAADMALMNKLAFWAGGDAVQMERIFSASSLGKRSKWRDRADYRERTIKKALSDIKEFYKPAVSTEPKEPDNNYLASKTAALEGPTVLDAFQKLLDHEDKITGDCAWPWRRYKPQIEKANKQKYLSRAGEDKAHKFLKKFKNNLAELGIDYDNLYPLPAKPASDKEEFSREIMAKAFEILQSGDPVQFVADACGRAVIGAETAFKKLCCCVSVQNIRQSAGLHPKFNGESGGGKTFISYTFINHLAKEMFVKGSMSAKSGFYHKNGDRILRVLDDYAAGNEDLDTLLKQTSSDFHEPYQHRTLIKQVATTLEIGREQTWLVTSVDSSQDIQVLNRQIPINVDDSCELTVQVNNRTVKRYGEGEEQRPIDETVLICRAMFQILREDGYIKVRVPFWERIEWLDTTNRRNPSIFMDLVIAYTAMFRYQRARDSEGYYLASEADFVAAKELFTDRDGEELVQRLTRRERDVLEKLIANPPGLTRDDLAEKLHVAPERITQIIRGQKGMGGLMAKIAIRETKISEMRRIDEDTKKTVHMTIFSLKDYDKFAGFDAVVRLKPAPEGPDKQDKHDIMHGISKLTDNGEDRVSKISKERKERKKRKKERRRERLTQLFSCGRLFFSRK